LLQRIKRADPYTLRGVIYLVIGCLGISYELFIRSSTEWLVITLYGAIVGIGLICIFLLKARGSLAGRAIPQDKVD